LRLFAADDGELEMKETKNKEKLSPTVLDHSSRIQQTCIQVLFNVEWKKSSLSNLITVNSRSKARKQEKRAFQLKKRFQ
jgi:hypothetical protein